MKVVAMRSKFVTNILIIAFIFILLIYIIYSWTSSSENNEAGRLNFVSQPQAPPVHIPTKEDRQAMENIWNYVYKMQYNCTDEAYLGGKMGTDGAYYLCKEKKHWPFPPEKSKDKCLVYSFGISWDFKFDDAIATLGCEVHAFDPSMERLPEGTIRPSGVVFHQVGIAETDDDHGFKGWKMRTLKTLMKELGHENRVLDYLKVDTDKGDGTGFEDVLMRELVETGMYKCVRQFGMEIHMPGPLANEKSAERCKDLLYLLTTLKKGGFRLYQTVDNVRALQYYQPKANQMMVKQGQFSGGPDVVLWENHFVNVDLKGTCRDYMN